MTETERPVPGDGHEEAQEDAARRARVGIVDPAAQVRAADLEPYVGLRYVSRLFRIIAMIILMLLVAEIAVGFYQEGWGSVWALISEISRLLVLAGLLWGAGELMILLIDIGHDVRATRILIGRQAAHLDPDGPRTPTEAARAVPPHHPR